MKKILPGLLSFILPFVVMFSLGAVPVWEEVGGVINAPQFKFNFGSGVKTIQLIQDGSKIDFGTGSADELFSNGIGVATNGSFYVSQGGGTTKLFVGNTTSGVSAIVKCGPTTLNPGASASYSTLITTTACAGATAGSPCFLGVNSHDTLTAAGYAVSCSGDATDQIRIVWQCVPVGGSGGCASPGNQSYTGYVFVP